MSKKKESIDVVKIMTKSLTETINKEIIKTFIKVEKSKKIFFDDY